MLVKELEKKWYRIHMTLFISKNSTTGNLTIKKREYHMSDNWFLMSKELSERPAGLASYQTHTLHYLLLLQLEETVFNSNRNFYSCS